MAEAGGAAGSSLATRFLGAPHTLTLERRVPGELDSKHFDTLIPILQGGTAGTRQASTVGKALTWTSTAGNNARRLQVLVIAQDGETRVRLEERSWEVAMAFHMGLGMGSFGFAIPGGMAAGAAVGAVVGLGVLPSPPAGALPTA